MTNTRSAVTLFISVALLLTSTVSYAIGDSVKTVDEGGSIYGYIVMDDGSFIDGSVTVRDGDLWIDEYFLYDDDYFEFIDLPEGLYTLYYYDIGEIPVSEGIDVSVRAGQGTDITLYVPYTFSGMSCDELMDWTYDEYRFAIDEAFQEAGFDYGWLSEMGEDRVADTYGQCALDLNNLRLEEMDPMYADLIFDVREAITEFEWAYYNVTFFQGTGSWHFPTRAIVDREYLVSTLIDFHYDPWQPDKTQMGYAMDVVDRLPDAADPYTGNWYSDQDAEDYQQALDDYTYAAEMLAYAMLNLDDDALVEVAEYIEWYLYADI